MTKIMHKLRLGVNIDHVATLRNARGGAHPCPIAAALLARDAGADGITAHLREDRRHIRDRDMERLMQEVNLPLNFEMAATHEMLEIALNTRPHAVCLVPEKREERTTEGGLDVAAQVKFLRPYVAQLAAADIRVSLFIDPEAKQLEAAVAIGAPVVELHTGHYAELADALQMAELNRIRFAASLGTRFGLEVHAGHGLNFMNVQPIAEIPEIYELNIGHFLIGEAVMMGLKPAIIEMRKLMDEARV